MILKVLIQDIDLVRWKQDLEEDRELLGHLLRDAKKIDAQRDAKLQKLKEVISDKINNPLNPDNKKVIIFTAFSDTAEYLYEQIATWARNEHDIHSALVTGSGTNQCTISVSITDMTLNDFRMDLSSFMKDNLSVLEKTPTGYYAAVSPANVLHRMREMVDRDTPSTRAISALS